jgi:hypothetical protein
MPARRPWSSLRAAWLNGLSEKATKSPASRRAFSCQTLDKPISIRDDHLPAKPTPSNHNPMMVEIEQDFMSMFKAKSLSLVLASPFLLVAPAGSPSTGLPISVDAAHIEAERTAASDAPSGQPFLDAMRTLPYVKRIELVEPSRPIQTIIHLRDWHYLPKDTFEADLRSVNASPMPAAELDGRYERFLFEVERVQAEQTAILRHLIRHHGLRQVFLEGLTERDMPIFQAKLESMKKLAAELPGYRDELAAAKQRLKDLETAGDDSSEGYLTDATLVVEIEALFQQYRLDLLRVGAAGQLVLAGELAEVVPVEDEVPFDAANPVGNDGAVTLDLENNERREDAQVGNLLKGGPVVVVILGGAHDLVDNIARLSGKTCRYAAVTTRAFDATAER